MKIGTIDFGERPLFLAPMEDVTDIGFRKWSNDLGAPWDNTVSYKHSKLSTKGVGWSFEGAEGCKKKREVGLKGQEQPRW